MYLAHSPQARHDHSDDSNCIPLSQLSRGLEEEGGREGGEGQRREEVDTCLWPTSKARRAGFTHSRKARKRSLPPERAGSCSCSSSHYMSHSPAESRYAPPSLSPQSAGARPSLGLFLRPYHMTCGDDGAGLG